MADINRGLGATYDQRVADRLSDARKSSGIIERFGENAMDYAKGAASAGGYGLMGLTTDIAGGLGSFLGGPFSEDAATLEAFSDEAYRRAVPLLTEGYTQGSRTAAKDAVPMFSFEDKLLRGQYEQDVADAKREANLTMPSDGTGRPREIQEQIDIFQALNPDAGPITTEQINQLSKGKRSKPFPEQPKKKGLKPFSEGVIEQEQIQADANREASLTMPSGTEVSASSVAPSMETMDEMDSASNLFIEALADTKKAKGEEPVKAKTREELLEKYKQEFADATGIDISGKPDTSQALMAMGLSMMQNRAGKGFNVGKMLSAVGEAGEKAMPELSRARQEAKAAKVAAGKYALGQIEKGESAAAAIAAEDKAFQRERYLKLLQMDADFEKERIKAGGKVAEVKNVKADKVINGLTVQRGRGATGAVFVFPQDALRDTAGALKSVNGALGTVDTMTDLATQISNEESPTFSLIQDRINTALVGAGLADAEVVFGDAKVGKQQQIEILQQSIITQFKRMLTQETGNGISKTDVEKIEQMLGKIDLLGNPQGSLKRLAEIKTLFMGKRRAIRGVLDELQDPELYPTEGEYTKNMELYPTLIQGNTAYRPVNGKDSAIDVADTE